MDVIVVCFPESLVDEEPTLEDAIGDLRLDNENSVEAVELCECSKKKCQIQVVKKITQEPDKVVSVGDDVVKYGMIKLSHTEKKWEKSYRKKKFILPISQSAIGIKHLTLCQNKDYKPHLQCIYM